MSKVEEKMLNMVVDMATYKGRLEAEQERHMKEIAERRNDWFSRALPSPR